MEWFALALVVQSTVVFVLSLLLVRVSRHIVGIDQQVDGLRDDVAKLARQKSDGWKWAIDAANSISGGRWATVSGCVDDLHDVFVSRSAYVVRRVDSGGVWVAYRGPEQSRRCSSPVEAVAELVARDDVRQMTADAMGRYGMRPKSVASPEAFGASAGMTIDEAEGEPEQEESAPDDPELAECQAEESSGILGGVLTPTGGQWRARR